MHQVCAPFFALTRPTNTTQQNKTKQTNKRKRNSANCAETGHGARCAFRIHIAAVAQRRTRVTPLCPRRGNAAVSARLVTTWLPSKWRRLRVRVDRLESGSAVAGSPPAGATTISAPCGILQYIGDRLHKTTPVHADPLCPPSPHSLLSPLAVFPPSLLRTRINLPVGVCGGLLFSPPLERQLLRRIIAGAKKSLHCSIGDW